MSADIQSLFESTKWHGKTIPSRILLAPINTGFARDHRPTFRLVQFHCERSGPTIGFSTVGNVAIAPDAAPSAETAVLSRSSDIPRFALIARTIKRKGSLAGIQIASSPIGLAPATRWKTPDLESEVKRLRLLTGDFSQDYLKQSLSQFLNAASLAEKAGFDLIQIHAAHGYLLSLLLNHALNPRTDEFAYNGTWVEEFVQQLNKLRGNALLSFRVSIRSQVEAGGEDDLDFRLANRLAQNGVDLVDFSSGFYTIDRHLIYPGAHLSGLPLYPPARDIALRLPCLVGFAGNILDLRDVPRDLPTNLFCSVGRALIADPDFAIKSSLGRFDEVRWCGRTGHCHYFTRGRSHLECGVNHALGGDRRSSHE